MSAFGRRKRRADRRIYRALYLLYRALFPSDAPAGRLRPAAVRRLLWVRHDAVGDYVVSTPALAYLRATLPHAEIDVVASPRNAALVGADPRVDRVHVNDGTRRGWLRTVRALRARRYDVVVNPVEPHHLREGLFTALVAGRRAPRASLRRAKRYAGFFTHAVRPPAGRPQAERLLRLAEATVGEGLVPRPPDLARWPMALPADAAADSRAAARLAALGAPVVAVHAWSADPRRSLSAAFVPELCVAVARRFPGAAVLLTPPRVALASAEAAASAANARLAGGGGPPRVHVADLALPELVAVLRRTRLLVSVDTANVHIACAVGTPVVSFSAPTLADPRQWGPVGAAAHVVALPGGRHLPTLRLDEALAGIEALLARAGGLGLAGPALPRRP